MLWDASAIGYSVCFGGLSRKLYRWFDDVRAREY